ncbi:MAG: hypothetical protein NTY04_01290 [Candidatus Staskawiczbacteria bacterium]|nr:hypothetical protein [Candidatus Staskawiczbacteria bacterium]
MLKEKEIVDIVKKYLKDRGYVIKNPEKTVNDHGCDIITETHKKWRKNYYIEAKGEGIGKNEHPTKNNAFWTLFGQTLSRMDIKGNDPKKGRIYAIAIPAKWEELYKNKISKMVYGWRLLKLKVFLVDDSQNVKEVSYGYFLKNKINN